jgi:DNA-directed RNA polymerase specialized sigma24 family protein
MASERDLLVDAFARTRIALFHPHLTDNERSALHMTYVQGWSDDDARGNLCMTLKEYRKLRSSALDKASVMPNLAAKAGVESRSQSEPSSSD